MNSEKQSKNEKMRVDLWYKINKLLVFLILSLVIIRLGFNDLDDIDQIKYALSMTALYMFMERYYPSVRID